MTNLWVHRCDAWTTFLWSMRMAASLLDFIVRLGDRSTGYEWGVCCATKFNQRIVSRYINEMSLVYFCLDIYIVFRIPFLYFVMRSVCSLRFFNVKGNLYESNVMSFVFYFKWMCVLHEEKYFEIGFIQFQLPFYTTIENDNKIYIFLFRIKFKDFGFTTACIVAK